MDRELAAAIAAHTVRLLVEQVLEIVVLLLVFALAAWAEWNGSLLGAYTAAGFGVFAYLWCRLIRGERRAKDGRQRELPAQREHDVPATGAD